MEENQYNNVDIEVIKLYQAVKSVKRLYKRFLVMSEDLKKSHDNNFKKLKEAFEDIEDVDLIVQADYFDEEMQEYFRKGILDAGNDCIREIKDIYKENYGN